MKLFLNSTEYIETEQSLDISMTLKSGDKNMRAWYVKSPEIEPVKSNGYIGSVEEGGSVNFRSIFFNPHGHGTHTECLGHITKEVYSVNDCVKNYFCKAQLITVEPERFYNEEYKEEDLIIRPELLNKIKWAPNINALVIRTKPNPMQKTTKDYSSTNPPYLHVSCMQVIEKLNIQHLLIDLPSVDRESDGGKLLFHHKFWNVPDYPDHLRTITELIYVRDEIEDGVYIMELQMAPFENDATPSRPVLYKINKN